MKSIAVLSVYFGPLPEWIQYFLVSVHHNPTIDFILITDQEIESSANFKVIHSSLEEYIERANSVLSLNIQWREPYKFCDLKPCLGKLYEAYIRDYDFFGFYDLDVIYGNLRHFLTDEILSQYEVFSTCDLIITGHFALFRNTKKHRNYYKRIPNFRKLLEAKENAILDEIALKRAYSTIRHGIWRWKAVRTLTNRLTKGMLRKAVARKKSKLYLKDFYTTPYSFNGEHTELVPWEDGTLNQPMTWFWKDGEVWYEGAPSKGIYLHFMNFKANNGRFDGTEAPWKKLDTVVHCSVEEMKNQGVTICEEGFLPGISEMAK